MVAAPTSAGKTVVAEYALWRALQDGTRAIYTTPIKALSNQKRRDLEAMYPGQVGLLTGDRSENPEAPIVVMTTEVLRNMLVEDAASLDHVAVVVFDEVHYLADPDRGTVWEGRTSPSRRMSARSSSPPPSPMARRLPSGSARPRAGSPCSRLTGARSPTLTTCSPRTPSTWS